MIRRAKIAECDSPAVRIMRDRKIPVLLLCFLFLFFPAVGQNAAVASFDLVITEMDVQSIMRAPFTMVASDSGVREFGTGVPHPRGYGNNARVLGRYVRELKLLTIEDAIRKMTSLPAQTFGLRNRGLIREGFAADFVIFDDTRIADRATFENPHQYPIGISRVFVNGAAVFADGKMTEARPGFPLRHGENRTAEK